MNHIKSLFALLAVLMLAACSEKTNDGNKNITEAFRERWNINEEVIHNSDGSITYYSVTWGGLVANFTNSEQPENWSDYDKIIFEFAEPTSVNTQIVLNERVISIGSPGITKLSSPLVGIDVSDVKQVALQTAEPTTIKVKRVVLTKSQDVGLTTSIWDGECVLGNWTGGFEIPSTQFKNASAGDILEITYTTDISNPSVYYWQLKTIYSNTDKTLEGNANELNEWGCATMGKGTTRYRITLTEGDVEQLKKNGLFVNGYYITVTQCFLLQ